MNSTTVARVVLTLGALCTSNPPPAMAAAFTWVGADGAKWEVMGNWNQDGGQANRLPGAEDDVTLSVPQDQNRKKVLLGNAKTVKSLVVENISLEADAQAGAKSISIESTNDVSLDAKSQVIAATVAQGDAGSVTITSKSGKLTIAGKVAAGSSGNPQKGKGGEVDLNADGVISLTGSVIGGTSYDFAAIPQGGNVNIESKRGNIEIKGKVDAGNDAGNGAGGNARVASDGGDEVLIDHMVIAGNSGGIGGWTGGQVSILASKNGAQIKLGAACNIQAGEGANKVPNGRQGQGGLVAFSAAKVTDLQGASVKAGKGGINGGKGGSINFLPLDLTNPTPPDLDLKNGTYQGGDGGNGAGGGKAGDVQMLGKSLVNGKNILGGNNGSRQLGGTPTMGNVTAIIETSTSVLPGGLIRGGVIALISNPGGQFVLQDLDANAIFADASICIGGSAILSPSATIDLTGNPPGENVLVTAVGGQITLRGTVLLDPGVDLSDITEPNAIVSSLPCPCVEPPGETPRLAFAAGSLLRWTPLPFAESYEVLAGLLSELPVGPGAIDEVCMAGLTVPSTPVPGVPPVGDGFWFLVRTRNACGVGSYGFDGLAGESNVERVSTTCD
ncbi:MAG TPA: hypothetical protein VJS92_03680 [Candidatus Polarisedimenticolaceae bacterium]|nr:hypothetical protein [Candidatus Polarisedimenticolaceae bacterium]